MILMTACVPAWKPPAPAQEVGFLVRAESAKNGDLSVRVAVPTREETLQLFGTSLYDNRIQPVWVSVENRSDERVVLMRTGVDENLFSPLEAAYQRHAGSKEEREAMDIFFHSMAFHNPVPARGTAEGFLFTNLDEGAKAINIDLLGDQKLTSFSFVVPVPGLVTDIQQVDLSELYPEEERVDIQDAVTLQEVLADLPCCTRNAKDTKNGDPLNIVMIGPRKDIFSALIRQDWHQTEVTYAASAWKTTKSFLFGSRYRYSPISSLYVFGRPQDIGLQKARHSITLRNHMRLWLTPYRFRGDEVFIGQISRDIGVKFSKRTITTHAIDPDVDDTRDGLVGDMAYSNALHSVGYVHGSQRSTRAETYYNLTPDPYFSDGLRAVMFFGERPHALDDVELLDWGLFPSSVAE
jgi:hypothetical protein